MKKLGIFAGTFDPVHFGHRAFAEQAIIGNDLEKLFILIEKSPRFKACLAPYEDRKAMVKLAFAGNPQIIVRETSSDDFPISSDLPLVRLEFPEAQIFLLIGEDVAKHVDAWENADELLKNVKLIIGKRNEDVPYGKVSSAKIREAIRQADFSNVDSKVQKYISERKIY